MTTEPDASEAASQQPNLVSPRSPIVAAVLSLVMTGLGHIYCGKLVTGLAWAAVGAFSGVVSLYALATQSAGLMTASLPMCVISIAATVHAWMVARSCSPQYELQSFNRWYVYLLLIGISSFGAAGHGVLIRSDVVQSFVTPSKDMMPTLQAGDRFLVNMTAFRASPVKVGHVIIFKHPETPSRIYVKRVVAMAGDVLEIREGQLLINGEQSNVEELDMSGSEDFGPVTVPDFNCYVLGDNVAQSKDSRHFGPIPLATVLGEATVRYWPLNRAGDIE